MSRFSQKIEDAGYVPIYKANREPYRAIARRAILHARLFFAPGKRLDLTDEQAQLLDSRNAMDDRDKELVRTYIQGITRQ